MLSFKFFWFYLRISGWGPGVAEGGHKWRIATMAILWARSWFCYSSLSLSRPHICSLLRTEADFNARQC